MGGAIRLPKACRRVIPYINLIVGVFTAFGEGDRLAPGHRKNHTLIHYIERFRKLFDISKLFYYYLLINSNKG